MKKIIITAADENFSQLLIELINSLVQFDEPLADAIGLLDLGLSSYTLGALGNKIHNIVKPDWDLVVNENVAKQKPHLRALTSRPFLTKYFPGYDLYLWLDADTWVQNRFAVDALFAAASTGALGIVPQVHQSYAHRQIAKWRINSLNSYYKQDGYNLYLQNTYFNAGVFAFKERSAPLGFLGKNFQIGLDNCDSKQVCDQTALNYSIWTDKLSVYPLPAICNWCCHLALPSVNPNSGKFCEPHIPHGEIGIIHMTAKTKDIKFRRENSSSRYPVNLHYSPKK